MYGSKAYAVAPRFKGVAVQEGADVETYRDAQDLSTNNIASSTLEFFPTNASSSAAQSNYIRKPLPRDIGYDVLGLGIGFGWDSLAIQPANQSNITLDGLINDSLHAQVLFETGKKDKLVDRHVHEFSGIQEVDYDVVGSDAGATGDGFTRVAGFPSSLVYRLDHPFHLEAQESWTFDVTFASTTNIPSDTEWSNVSKGTLQMIATVFVAFQDNIPKGPPARAGNGGNNGAPAPA